MRGVIAIFAMPFVLSVAGTGDAFAGCGNNQSCSVQRNNCGGGHRTGCSRHRDPHSGVFFMASRLRLGFAYATRPGMFIMGGFR